MNERLRDALLTSSITPAELAKDLNVHPRTAERWITQDRTPYPRYQHAIAARVDKSQGYLWPGSGNRAAGGSSSEVLEVYPHRSAVPDELWDQLLEEATTYVDILVYVGMFLTEKPDLVSLLTEKAENGLRIRMLYGDRDCEAVRQRSIDEGIGEYTVPAKIDQALAHVSTLSGVGGIQVRTHRTTLYNSIYRFDDQMLVNPHIYGKTAPHAPAIHLKRLGSGRLFTSYADSFDAVWDGAEPYTF